MTMTYDQEIVEVNGVPVLPMPLDLLEDLGWGVGDGLELEDDGMGGIIVRKSGGTNGELDLEEDL